MIFSASDLISLKLTTFDLPGNEVAEWMEPLLENWSEEIDGWLLLEQMHKFKFEGPEVAEKIRPLITIDSLSTYGLRGRLFWKTGQIEWRRLSPHQLRVVIIHETSNSSYMPEVENIVTEDKKMQCQDDRLILWGTSKNGGGMKHKFYEQRVAGSAQIEYPLELEYMNTIIDYTGYPVLPFRTYLNAEGRAEFRRFLPPMVYDELILRKPVQFETLTGKETKNG